MARSADPELRRWWRELIDSFDSTRESVSEFCHRHKVSTASFYGWRRKLASRASAARSGSNTPKATAAKESTGRSRQVVRSPSFLPVHIINTEESSSRSVHVHLPGGVSIELPVQERELLFDLVARVRGQSSAEATEAVT